MGNTIESDRYYLGTFNQRDTLLSSIETCDGSQHVSDLSFVQGL